MPASANGPAASGAASGSSSGGAPARQTLPPKENALFKRVLKCYEQKQYKNGLKFAKQILSNPKFVEHGETLSMKGLTLNCLGRKEEAYEHVRRGLRNDLRSPVCWHVYGLLQRSDKKYDEAIKCYRNALKWDKDNIQILRDLSLLQIQMRDLEGYKDTRYQLFQLRPTQRASWIGFAMSYHLLNDYDMSLKILEEFRKTQQKAAYDYEHSELLLYQNMVIQESGDAAAALEHLNQYREQICDKGTFLETKGNLLLQCGRLEDASEVFSELIRRNPENHSYYRQMEKATKCENSDQKLAMYADYRNKFPKAQAPQRLQLDIAQGESFRRLVDQYLRRALTKGIPPLFVDLRPLYADPEKAKTIEQLCQSYLTNLGSPSGSYDSEGTPREPATAVLWTLYYLSQHHDYLGDHQLALQLVEQAIDHTPTLIELYLLKGKIYKHVGDLEESVRWLDEAQSLDTADRYINCKCAKYMLRAGQVRRAEEMCAKFTREGVPPTENLNEMQCMWFQTEAARAYRWLHQWGEALKKCIEVDRHFTEIVEDQFDFHTYCMRKMTLRSYVELLRLEDVLRSQKFYERAAHTAINVYLRLHDRPLAEEDKLNDVDTENMDPSELKKLRNKQKKARRRAEQERLQQQQQQAKKELHQKSQKKSGDGAANAGGDEAGDGAPKDELIPEKLERPENALEEAIKFLRPLQALASKRVDTHVLAFDIYWRRRRPLLMLQSVKRGLKAAAASSSITDGPRLHSCLVRMQHFVEENSDEMSEAVKEVFKREEGIFGGAKSASERNEEFLRKNATSLPHVVAGAKMSIFLDSSLTESALEKVTQLDNCTSGVDLLTCSDIYDSLSGGEFGAAGTAASDSFRERCAKLFPLAVKFRSEEEKQKQHNDEESKVVGQSQEEVEHLQ